MDEVVSMEWTLHAGQLGGHPAVMRLRDGAFARERGTPEFSIAVVVQVALNDPTDAGLTTDEEGDELAHVEDALVGIVGDRGILVSVITGLGLRQYTWYGAAHDWAGELLSRIDATIPSHGMRVLARVDPEWRVARQLLDE